MHTSHTLTHIHTSHTHTNTQDYRPETISSHFNDAHIVVYPLKNGLFRIQILKKSKGMCVCVCVWNRRERERETILRDREIERERRLRESEKREREISCVCVCVYICVQNMPPKTNQNKKQLTTRTKNN